MLKTFSLISDIDKANQKVQYSKRNCSATTPGTNKALVYLFISGQEKDELWIFLKLFSNSVMFHIVLQFITHGWPFISLFLCNID